MDNAEPGEPNAIEKVKVEVTYMSGPSVSKEAALGVPSYTLPNSLTLDQLYEAINASLVEEGFLIFPSDAGTDVFVSMVDVLCIEVCRT